MLRYLLFAFACVAVLGLAVPASISAEPAPAPRAEPVKAKHGAPAKAKWRVNRFAKGYGFLPGYEPPPQRGLYDRRESWSGDGPRFWSRGRYYYGWGGPGYYRGQWNGGGFGPCWTQTPMGQVWNCGR